LTTDHLAELVESLSGAERRSVPVRNSRKSLVLAGGGVTGIGWELGILAGLAERGLDLSDADVIVGTSAGSVVGAQLTSGVALEELYAEQLRDPSGEIAAEMGLGLLFRFVLASVLPGGDRRARARLGRLALTAKTVPEAERRAVIESRLPRSRSSTPAAACRSSTRWPPVARCPWCGRR
jgi:NTE family protein